MAIEFNRSTKFNAPCVFKNLHFRLVTCNFNHFPFQDCPAHFNHGDFPLTDASFKLHVKQVSKCFDDFSSCDIFHFISLQMLQVLFHPSQGRAHSTVPRVNAAPYNPKSSQWRKAALRPALQSAEISTWQPLLIVDKDQAHTTDIFP